MPPGSNLAGSAGVGHLINDLHSARWLIARVLFRALIMFRGQNLLPPSMDYQGSIPWTGSPLLLHLAL